MIKFQPKAKKPIDMSLTTSQTNVSFPSGFLLLLFLLNIEELRKGNICLVKFKNARQLPGRNSIRNQSAKAFES